jgi:Tol biopolymer transport system component
VTNRSISHLASFLLVLALVGGALSCDMQAPEEAVAAAAPSGDWLGQQPPGATPELFARGTVSTGADELNAVFSPDGTEFLFTVKTPDRVRHTLMFMEREGDDWTAPRTLPFSGRYSDADPAFAPDGNRIYFISMRPLEGEGPPRENWDWDLWAVDRTADGWGEPWNLGAPVNTDAMEVYPSVAADGTLYFSSGRPGGQGENDIYRSRIVDGEFGEPENLGDAINSEHSEGDLFIAPDESYIVFVSSGRPDSIGRGDLYVSFRDEDGAWTPAINLGEGVNSRWTEYCPSVSPGGKYLFFTSYRVVREEPSATPLTYEEIQSAYVTPQSGMGDVYWVDAAVLEALRP